jgi:hypothetical protein
MMYGAKQARACDAKLFRGRKASQLQIICTRRGVYQTLQIFFVCIIFSARMAFVIRALFTCAEARTVGRHSDEQKQSLLQNE